MSIEYGGSRSFEKYIRNKEEKIPLSYNKKYNAEIEESYENFKNGSLLFMNCNFYIDDLVSLYSLFNSTKDLSIPNTIPDNEGSYYMNSNNYTINSPIKSEFYYGNTYNNLNINEEEINKTPIKSEYYDITDEMNATNTFDSFMRSYQNISTCKPSVYNFYINKKEKLEILILKNGGQIHNTLTSKVTHIISNNMALGSKKYLDYKKAIKKYKIFIVIDKYIFDCVICKCRLSEQLYLPRSLCYNCHQITEYFPFKKKEKKKNYSNNNNNNNNDNNKSSLNYFTNNNGLNNINSKAVLYNNAYDNTNNICNNASNINNNNINKETTKDTNLGNNNTSNLEKIPITPNNNIITFNKENRNVEKDPTQDEKMEILNMQMDYENLKKYLISNSNEYFKKSYKFYLDKELKETDSSKEYNLQINQKNFEEFARKYRILNYLSEKEIKWIKEKSNLNISIKNVWGNDLIHFFFDIVLEKKKSHKKKSMPTVVVSNPNGMENNKENESIEKEKYEIKNGKANSTTSENNEMDVSDKLIDSISDYLYNSRLYILGNWNYIAKEFFNFKEINKSENRKFVYLYIDFDNYFLNASVKNNNSSINCEESARNEILCVCHSLIKEESYGIISSTNYWGKKKKIFKGMLKGEATKLHKNIRFIKYDFSNILKCSYLFLLVMINYSKYVKVISVDESIVQLFYEKEEDIFLIAKKISDDIYNLTKLYVSIGISNNLSLSNKALKFCKKRFLFFDFYHNFNIFLIKYVDIKKKEEKKGENAGYESLKEIPLENNIIYKSGSSEEKIGIKDNMKFSQNSKTEKSEETNRNSDELANVLESNIDIENLFSKYLTFEETKKKELESVYMVNTYNNDNANNYFLNIMKEKREKNIDFIFDKFMQINKKNLEYITNTFFEKIEYPISKYFFFYKRNDYYLNILKKFNYLNGAFIDFNIYYFPTDTVLDNTIEKSKNKKELEILDEKKSINVSINYGVRFQKINDFYYLIYFMVKQLYLRLKIKNLKAKSLGVSFFMRDENENINPIKYLGRGRVIKISTKIKLSYYTDFFFIFFFKVIYNFNFLASNLSELRGVQIICSDIINDKYNINKKSILYYFDMKNKNCKIKENIDDIKIENTNSLKVVEHEKEENNQIISEMYKKEKSLLKTTKEKGSIKAGKKTNKINATKRKNKKNKIATNKKVGNNKERMKKATMDLNENKKNCFRNIINKRSILSYFMNNSRNIDAKNELTKKPIHFSSKKCKKRNVKKNYLKRNTVLSNKIKITKNYKIWDFFPNILNKRKENNIYSDETKKYMNKNNLVVQTNIFDSIINKRLKMENQIKEEVGCCYLCYKEIYETVKEKQNMHTNSINCKEECANNIFCYTYVSNYLYSINQKNEKFNFYMYIKKIVFSHTFYFNSIFQNHNCNKQLRDEYYLHKFILNILDGLCETLHNNRYIDVLHNFLKVFKYVWCLNKNSFPPSFQNILTKYNSYQTHF